MNRDDSYLKPLRITPLEERILLDAAAAADIATQAAAQETDHQVEKQAQEQQQQEQNPVAYPEELENCSAYRESGGGPEWRRHRRQRCFCNLIRVLQ